MDLAGIERSFAQGCAGGSVHGALYLAFVIWNVAHHMIYVFSREPLSRGRLIFNASGDLLGNGWRHLILVALVPQTSFAELLGPLVWLNLFHAATHVFGIAWAALHPASMLPYVTDFQHRRLPRWQLTVNWIIEQNDMALYVLTGALVVPLVHPLLTMLVVMVCAPLWLPRRGARDAATAPSPD